MKIIFMGTPDFAVPCLDVLVHNGYDVAAVVTQPDKPYGRKQSELKAPAVKMAALRHGIATILQPDKVKTPEFAAAIGELAPDLIVTAAYGRILPKAVLDVPRYGCINVHASLLPKYRGPAPIQWALINGDETTGITIILMDEGMDTGDILLKEEMPIDPDMNCQELFDNLKELGAKALQKALKALESGSLTRTPQDHSKAVYVPMIIRETGLIDWSKSAARIHNLVRGTTPWPGAYTFYKGVRMKVFNTCVPKEYPPALLPGCGGDSREDRVDTATAESAKTALPGTILRISGQCLVVATGNGCIAINELQFENCRRMGVCECGHNMDEGEVLG